MKRAKKTGRGRKWRGGYVHHEADGLELFIIERQVAGRRFHVSTRCHDERSALEQLVRFEANPAGYSPAGVEPEAKLVLTNELIAEFFEHQLGKGNTRHYAKECVRKLRDWMLALGMRDLRRLSLHQDLKPLLLRWKTSRPARIIALKSFCTWLRRERGLLRHHEDPTLDLPVPQASPEKHVRRKVVPFDVVLKVYRHLTPRVRDVLDLFTATGWHITEVERFVRNPACTIEEPGVETRDEQGRLVLAVLRTWHKTKKWTRTSLVHQHHVDAARRLKADSTVPRKLNDAIKEAAEVAGVTRFTFGVMRHSVATWGIELGSTVEAAANHLDHADKRTTQRFYADVMVPKPPIRTRVLSLESEPDAKTLN